MYVCDSYPEYFFLSRTMLLIKGARAAVNASS